MVRLVEKTYFLSNLSLKMSIKMLSGAKKQTLWASKVLRGRHYNELNQEHVDKDASNS